MRTLTLNAALLSALLSSAALLATPVQAVSGYYKASNKSDARENAAPTANDRRHVVPAGLHATAPGRPWRGEPGHRPHGKYWYKYPPYRPSTRYRHHYRGDDFWGWLAFTAITLAIIDSLNEQQQREHELALHRALGAPVGETIRWSDTNASGAVTVTREGTSSLGRYCREYSQQIRIGGEIQRAYGTACRNRDGSWEIVN